MCIVYKNWGPNEGKYGDALIKFWSQANLCSSQVSARNVSWVFLPTCFYYSRQKMGQMHRVPRVLSLKSFLKRELNALFCWWFSFREVAFDLRFDWSADGCHWLGVSKKKKKKKIECYLDKCLIILSVNWTKRPDYRHNSHSISISYVGKMWHGLLNSCNRTN